MLMAAAATKSASVAPREGAFGTSMVQRRVPRTTKIVNTGTKALRSRCGARQTWAQQNRVVLANNLAGESRERTRARKRALAKHVGSRRRTCVGCDALRLFAGGTSLG